MKFEAKAWLATALIGAAVLLRFPPEKSGFYPKCPFFEAFGLLCPGCGATRAVSALLHGHLNEALRWNALFVGVLPVIPLYSLAWRHLERLLPLRSWLVAAGLAGAVAFAVARNLTWPGWVSISKKCGSPLRQVKPIQDFRHELQTFALDSSDLKYLQ